MNPNSHESIHPIHKLIKINMSNDGYGCTYGIDVKVSLFTHNSLFMCPKSQGYYINA
jgi:hypothetical protein